MSNELAKLILCERNGRWATALRRELHGTDVRIHETRSLTECWAVFAESPAGLAVVELTAANVENLLGRMARLETDFPHARVAVVAERRLADYKRLIREAGAVHFTCSPRCLGPLARLAARHLDQAPQPRRGFAEQVWAELPWENGGSPDDE